MGQKLTLTIDPGQVIAVTLSGFAEGISVSPVTNDTLVSERAAALAREEVLMRVYHMGTKPTVGLSYDDRLFKRIRCSSHTAYSYLKLSGKRGGIRHTRVGSKYLITEQAVREWLGDMPATQR
jgi:excisionase family DNA binding protein